MKDEVMPLHGSRLPSALAKLAFVAMLTDSPVYLSNLYLDGKFLRVERYALKMTRGCQQGVTQFQ
jgi:hypothetical protein